MSPTAASELPAEDGRWAYEVKSDGWRLLGYLDRGVGRFESRRGNDLTPELPELAPLAASIKRRRAVVDGELVALDDEGRPSFSRLSQRMRAGTPARLALFLFDLLHLDGQDLVKLPYRERRARLAELALDGPAWQTTSYATRDGAALLRLSREHQLEGIVAKRLDSPYEPGKRTTRWIKVKNYQEASYRLGAVVRGRDGTIDKVLVGTPRRDGALDFVGYVAVEHGGAALRAIADVLAELGRPSTPFVGAPRPLRGIVFVEPLLELDLRFLERTEDAHFRHAMIVDVRVTARATP